MDVAPQKSKSRTGAAEGHNFWSDLTGTKLPDFSFGEPREFGSRLNGLEANEIPRYFMGPKFTNTRSRFDAL